MRSSPPRPVTQVRVRPQAALRVTPQATVVVRIPFRTPIKLASAAASAAMPAASVDRRPKLSASTVDPTTSPSSVPRVVIGTGAWPIYCAASSIATSAGLRVAPNRRHRTPPPPPAQAHPPSALARLRCRPCNGVPRLHRFSHRDTRPQHHRRPGRHRLRTRRRCKLHLPIPMLRRPSMRMLRPCAVSVLGCQLFSISVPTPIWPPRCGIHPRPLLHPLRRVMTHSWIPWRPFALYLQRICYTGSPIPHLVWRSILRMGKFPSAPSARP